MQKSKLTAVDIDLDQDHVLAQVVVVIDLDRELQIDNITEAVIDLRTQSITTTHPKDIHRHIEIGKDVLARVGADLGPESAVVGRRAAEDLDIREALM